MMRWGITFRRFGGCAAVLVGFAAFGPALAADGPFSGLGGSWGGSGTVKYSDGSTERMRCSARYSGGGSDVSLSIKCNSAERNIDVSGRLHANEGHIGGSWNESNLGLSGSAVGKSSPGHLALGLEGSVSGSMSVSFSESHQDVAIRVAGATLESVNMSMGKR